MSAVVDGDEQLCDHYDMPDSTDVCVDGATGRPVHAEHRPSGAHAHIVDWQPLDRVPADVFDGEAEARELGVRCSELA